MRPLENIQCTGSTQNYNTEQQLLAESGLANLLGPIAVLDRGIVDAHVDVKDHLANRP